MSKVFNTTLTKEELIGKMKYIKDNHLELCKNDSVIFSTAIEKNNRLLVLSNSRTHWNFDFETNGQIKAKRYLSFSELLTLILLVIVDVAAVLISNVIFDMNAWTVLATIAVLLLLEIPALLTNHIKSWKIVKKFITKYLEATLNK